MALKSLNKAKQAPYTKGMDVDQHGAKISEFVTTLTTGPDSEKATDDPTTPAAGQGLTAAHPPALPEENTPETTPPTPNKQKPLE